MTQPDLQDEYQVPFRIRLFRFFMRPVFRLVFRVLSQVRITGRENILSQGAYLIAINHISLFEPPLILAFWPIPPEAVGAVDIWDRRGQSTLARLYGGIPVHRGEYDRDLLERMLAALNAGKPLLIAPEGGRSHSPGMRRALPGVAYVMDKAQVPVVPVGITGTSDDFLKRALQGKRPRIEIRIGPPIILPPIHGKGEERRAARQENVDLIMKKIAALLPEEYHGVYAEPG
jgi:1-acyl-sn-glycerol-3-phosphate acyltransferase